MTTSQLNIGKFDVARQKLEHAIRLVLAGEESLSAHSLAFDAYRVLREKLPDEARRKLLIRLEDAVRLGEIPGFTSHSKDDPEDILKEHSPEAVHLTIALAIRAWKEHGQEETSLMQQFSTLPDPYKPEHRHSEALKAVAEGRVTLERLNDILNASSTASEAFIRVKKQ